MQKPISTKTHAILDYLTATTFIVLPEAMGWSTPLKRAVQFVGLGKLMYAMATDHEGGLVRTIPMKTHLVLDAIGGATLAALPHLVGDEDQDEGAAEVLGALGVFDIAAAPMTETTPTEWSPVRQAAQHVAEQVGAA
jgi:hypothetical protein